MSSDLIVRHSGLSWTEFKRDIFALLIPSGGVPLLGTFAFRGQRCSSWGLTASFDRVAIHLDAASRRDRYRRHIERFKDLVQRFGLMPSENYLRFAKNDDVIYEIIGQHHGLPTRLLDWSLSPYMAAYFAFFNADGREDRFVSIWALDCGVLERLVDPESCRVILTAPTGISRITAQHGVFTQNRSIFPDLVQLIDHASSGASRSPRNPLMHHFTLAFTEAKDVLSDLMMMGID